MEKIVMVEGMTCGHCEKAVKSALMELGEVKEVEVDLSTGKVVVKGENLQDKFIKDAIIEAGYQIKEME